MSPTRVLVADPVSIVRSGVRSVLQREGDFEVVEAADLEAVIGCTAADPPAIAIVDLDLPPDGLAAVTHLGRFGCGVVAWSYGPGPSDVFRAIRAGARGYLDKEVSVDGLVRSLRGLLRDEAVLPRCLATALVSAVHDLARDEEVRSLEAVLSPRELEVIRLVAGGAGNRQIAQELTISEFTVKRHMHNILRKLEVPTRRAAVALFGSALGDEAGAVMETPA